MTVIPVVKNMIRMKTCDKGDPFQPNRYVFMTIPIKSLLSNYFFWYSRGRLQTDPHADNDRDLKKCKQDDA